MIYVTRHHKAKRVTNREFFVVRFLPARLARVLFYYVVSIRRVSELLRREQVGYRDEDRNKSQQGCLLFQCDGQSWRPAHLTSILRRATELVWSRPTGIQLYRQLSIGIAEKHVREVCTLMNMYDDRSAEADLNVVLAWQSGHRPLQRGITYGLDGAFLTRLQPALLRAYDWASTRWHEFLHQPGKTLP